MPIRLDLVDGLRIVKSFPLDGDKPARVGRSAQSSIRLNDDRVSRRHCVLTPRGEECLLTDLGSHNGTKVNGHAVGEHQLRDGDQIVVGNTMLIFRKVEREAEPPPEKERAEESGELTVSMAKGPESSDHAVVRAVLRHRDSRYLNADLLEAIPGERTSETLKALYRVASTVLSIRSINELLNQLLDLVFETLPVERATVLLSTEGQLEARATKSRLKETSPEPQVSQTIAQRCFTENVAILSQDAMSDARFSDQQSVVMHGVRSAMCVPLSSGVKTWGVLYADKKTTSAFSEEQLDFLLAVSRQVGLALENLYLQDEHRKTFESLIRILAASIDAKDPVTAGHSDRVARYSMALADRLGLPREQKRVLRLAAYLHDYGKIGIRDAVLLKPAGLTPEEYQEIKEHPRYTGEILGQIHFAEHLKDIPKIAMSHHERMDGRGYPHGLKGDDIPLGSRIIAIADVWDALTSARQYKKGWKIDQAMGELSNLKGAHLDAELVDLFLRYVQEEVVPAAESGQTPPHKRRQSPLDTDEMPAPPPDDAPPKPPALW
ncbi:MAG: HD domain-containing phosphohydrolase [Acidobacteriota bacterium]